MYHEDYISEGYAHSDNVEAMSDPETYDERRERQAAERHYRRTSPTKAFQAAQAAPVGNSIRCPGCGKLFKKKSYQQKFCSNKGIGNCKDRYWNS